MRVRVENEAVGLDKSVIDRIVPKLRKLVEERYSEYIVYVYLFGSVVKGRATRESDIDVAIRFYDHTSREIQWNIIKEILSIVDEDLDIVNLNRASPVLRMIVYSRGKLVYCNNRYILFLDQNKALKLYNDFLHIAKPYYKKMMEYVEKRVAEKV